MVYDVIAMDSDKNLMFHQRLYCQLDSWMDSHDNSTLIIQMQLLSTLFLPLLNCPVLDAYLPRLIRNHTLRIRVPDLLRHKVMGMHVVQRKWSDLL